MHILAVEDNPDTQKLLQYMLRSEPEIELMVVAGIEDALDAAGDQAFDLLLLDINLSEERTGIDLLQQLRRQPAYEDVPALALTAYALPGDRERFFEAGFNGYVSKPFTRKDLLDPLRQAIDAAAR